MTLLSKLYQLLVRVFGPKKRTQEQRDEWNRKFNEFLNDDKE